MIISLVARAPLIENAAEPVTTMIVDLHLRGEVQEATHAFDLASCLLRYCQTRQEDLAGFVINNKLGRKVLKGIKQKARLYFRANNDSFMDKGKRDFVLSEIFAGGFPPCVGAWGVAEELSNRYGKSFLDEFLARHSDQEWVAKPGDAIPVPYVSPKEWAETANEWKLTDPKTRFSPTDPGRLAGSFSKLPWLRLVSHLADGWSVILDTRFAHALDQLHGSNALTGRRDITIGTALLNQDSKKGLEFDWEMDPDQTGSPIFFNVQPKMWVGQDERMRVVLDRAKSVANVLVYPELCACRDTQLDLVQQFHSEPSFVQVLVAGSTHCFDKNDSNAVHRRNRAAVALRARVSGYEHDKIRPFSYWAQADGEAEKVEHFEAIHSRKEFRICVSKAWFMSVLICKDCLDDEEIVPLLKEFGVNLLLVPAHTEKMELFEDLSSLVHRNQAVVVVANNPMKLLDGSDLRDGHALVMSPGRRPLSVVYGREPGQAPPRLLLFNFRGPVHEVQVV
jgi:predicted amidohydrolase